VKQFAAVLSLVTVVSVLPARGSAQAICRAAEEGWSPEGFLLSFGVGAYRPDQLNQYFPKMLFQSYNQWFKLVIFVGRWLSGQFVTGPNAKDHFDFTKRRCTDEIKFTENGRNGRAKQRFCRDHAS